MSLPVYNSQQIKLIEQQIFASGVLSADLMEQAGQAAFEVLQQCWPQAKKIIVLSGTGNNGGDGYVLARLAQQAG